MNANNTLPKIQAAVESFGFSAVIASNDMIIVRNHKNQVAATVTEAGVEQKYAGAKNLCGALVRNAINNALKG